MAASLRRTGLAAVLLAAMSGTAAADFTDDPDEEAVSAQPDGYSAAVALIDAARYAEALPVLRVLAERHPDHADTLNLLGFASRKTGDPAAARRFYDRALGLDPNHAGAREYRGELFVETGDLAAAKADLAALERICGRTCEAWRDLSAVIAAAEHKAE